MPQPYVIDAILRRQKPAQEQRPALHIREVEPPPARAPSCKRPARGVIVVDHTID